MNVVVRRLTPGLLPYRAGLALQSELHKRVQIKPQEQYIIALEHPPVITLGKHATTRHILAADSWFQAAGVDVVRTSRGGEVTVHMPGQLVLYPILHLTELELMPKQYVHLLEEATIRTLAEWGIAAHRDSAYPGVWVGEKKICAVGIRIKERVSLHGIALNVVNNLELFGMVVPCGIQQRSVTSMCEVAKVGNLTFEAVTERLLANLSQLLGYDIFPPVTLTELAIERSSLYNQGHIDI